MIYYFTSLNKAVQLDEMKKTYQNNDLNIQIFDTEDIMNDAIKHLY